MAAKAQLHEEGVVSWTYAPGWTTPRTGEVRKEEQAPVFGILLQVLYRYLRISTLVKRGLRLLNYNLLT